jgi:hypothetical protein
MQGSELKGDGYSMCSTEEDIVAIFTDLYDVGADTISSSEEFEYNQASRGAGNVFDGIPPKGLV